MSGLTIGEIRDALKAQLVANLERQVNVSARGETMQGFPLITIRNLSGDYDRALGHELSDLELELEIDPGGEDASAVARIDDFLSSGLGNNSSIIDAIDVDPKLGGAVDDCAVKSYRREGDALAFLRLVIMARRDQF